MFKHSLGDRVQLTRNVDVNGALAAPAMATGTITSVKGVIRPTYTVATNTGGTVSVRATDLATIPAIAA